jgi:hypothetical protein
MSKTVKDFLTFSLNDVAVANVCIMKKTIGLCQVSERRYLIFSSLTFSKILVTLTALTVCHEPSGTPEFITPF